MRSGRVGIQSAEIDASCPVSSCDAVLESLEILELSVEDYEGNEFFFIGDEEPFSTRCSFEADDYTFMGETAFGSGDGGRAWMEVARYAAGADGDPVEKFLQGICNDPPFEAEYDALGTNEFSVATCQVPIRQSRICLADVAMLNRFNERGPGAPGGFGKCVHTKALIDPAFTLGHILSGGAGSSAALDRTGPMLIKTTGIEDVSGDTIGTVVYTTIDGDIFGIQDNDASIFIEPGGSDLWFGAQMARSWGDYGEEALLFGMFGIGWVDGITPKPRVGVYRAIRADADDAAFVWTYMDKGVRIYIR